MQKSKAKLWRESLETKAKKLNKKDVKSLLSSRIVSITEIGKGQNKQTVVVGKNYAGRMVTLINRKEDDALADLATLNGYSLE